VLKGKLENSFAKKDLVVENKILGMRITRDRKIHNLTLSESDYIENVLEIFNMYNAKPISTPLASHFKLRKGLCPKTQEEMDYMCKVPFASIIGRLMYAMACTRPHISHEVGFLSMYMKLSGFPCILEIPQIKNYALVVQTYLYRDMLMQIW